MSKVIMVNFKKKELEGSFDDMRQQTYNDLDKLLRVALKKIISSTDDGDFHRSCARSLGTIMTGLEDRLL